jgi:hypothetical protein
MEGNREPSQAVTEVVDRILELPFDAQLGVLRTIAPQLIGRLGDLEREGFLRDLNLEIETVVEGGAPYDMRPDRPSHLSPPERQPET